MRLAKYKKESKELLTYLLFEAHDEDRYVDNVKNLIETQFSEMNQHHVYLAKKTIRKVLRTANKYINYSKNTKTEVELRLYFCTKFKESGILSKNSLVLTNLYNNQIAKIKTALTKLHEDLQSDYGEELNALL